MAKYSTFFAPQFRTALLLIGLVATPAMSWCQSSGLGAPERQQLRTAVDSDNAGHPELAEVPLRQLFARHPDNFEVVESLALVYAELGKYTSSYPLMEKAVRLKPGSALACANLGSLDLKMNRNEAAVSVLRKAATLDPSNVQTQMTLGLAAMRTHQPKLAAEAFGRAANAASPTSYQLYNWSVALLAAGEIDQAAAVAARIQNADSSAQVQGLLADLAERQGHFKEAVSHYQKAVDLNPTESNIYALAMEFCFHWTFDPAIKIFNYGLVRYPSSTLLLSGLGIARYANNNYRQAARIFAELLTRDPNNSLYAEILGHSCNLLPESTPGCSGMIEFAKAHPRNAQASLYGAQSLLHRASNEEDNAEAEKLLRRALADNARLADAWYQLGVLHQQEGKWQASEAELEKCVALQPKISRYHYRLALAYAHTGKRDKAKREFALQQQYSREERAAVNTRLQEVTTFLVANRGSSSSQSSGKQ